MRVLDSTSERSNMRLDMPMQSHLNKTQKMTDLKNMEVTQDDSGSMKGGTLKPDQANHMIVLSNDELNRKEPSSEEPIINLNI